MMLRLDGSARSVQASKAFVVTNRKLRLTVHPGQGAFDALVAARTPLAP